MGIWENFWAFIDKGGDVLLIIFAVAVLLWYLIVERIYFFKNQVNELVESKISVWQAKEDKNNFWSMSIREAYIADIRIALFKNVGMIKTIVVLCPLLGLLGTVSGMMVVFEVMAVSGTNARMMAGGISMATIPTMAGMVVALSGIYFGSLIEKKAEQVYDGLSEKFVI